MVGAPSFDVRCGELDAEAVLPDAALPGAVLPGAVPAGSMTPR